MSRASCTSAQLSGLLFVRFTPLWIGCKVYYTWEVSINGEGVNLVHLFCILLPPCQHIAYCNSRLKSLLRDLRSDDTPKLIQDYHVESHKGYPVWNQSRGISYSFPPILTTLCAGTMGLNYKYTNCKLPDFPLPFADYGGRGPVNGSK